MLTNKVRSTIGWPRLLVLFVKTHQCQPDGHQHVVHEVEGDGRRDEVLRRRTVPAEAVVELESWSISSAQAKVPAPGNRLLAPMTSRWTCCRQRCSIRVPSTRGPARSPGGQRGLERGPARTPAPTHRLDADHQHAAGSRRAGDQRPWGLRAQYGGQRVAVLAGAGRIGSWRSPTSPAVASPRGRRQARRCSCPRRTPGMGAGANRWFRKRHNAHCGTIFHPFRSS